MNDNEKNVTNSITELVFLFFIQMMKIGSNEYFNAGKHDN
jgi:hypothetical protein